MNEKLLYVRPTYFYNDFNPKNIFNSSETEVFEITTEDSLMLERMQVHHSFLKKILSKFKKLYFQTRSSNEHRSYFISDFCAAYLYTRNVLYSTQPCFSQANLLCRGKRLVPWEEIPSFFLRKFFHPTNCISREKKYWIFFSFFLRFKRGCLNFLVNEFFMTYFLHLQSNHQIVFTSPSNRIVNLRYQ